MPSFESLRARVEDPSPNAAQARASAVPRNCFAPPQDSVGRSAGRNGWSSFLDCQLNTRWLNPQLCIRKARRLVSTLSRGRLQPAYDVLHLGGEINVMMHHLPAPCFSAIDIRDATIELPPLTGESCLDAFRAYRVG